MWGSGGPRAAMGGAQMPFTPWIVAIGASIIAVLDLLQLCTRLEWVERTTKAAGRGQIASALAVPPEGGGAAGQSRELPEREEDGVRNIVVRGGRRVPHKYATSSRIMGLDAFRPAVRPERRLGISMTYFVSSWTGMK
jgi:hypothetical protein